MSGRDVVGPAHSMELPRGADVFEVEIGSTSGVHQRGPAKPTRGPQIEDLGWYKSCDAL